MRCKPSNVNGKLVYVARTMWFLSHTNKSNTRQENGTERENIKAGGTARGAGTVWRQEAYRGREQAARRFCLDPGT
jgi:hypothetical protein